MSKFNLTAQIQLQAPKNAKQVVNQIQRQLSGVNVTLNLKNGPQAQKQVNNLTKATKNATSAAQALGKELTVSIKRYAGMAIATRAVSLFTNSLGSAIKEAIDFERELIKVVQVTGKSITELRGLTNEITRLSTAFGASSTSLVNVSRILSQAGLNANETKVALDALARSTLAPTFDDIASTAEGAVAIFNQFRQGAEALEKQLGAINAVAGKFAVEAGDLIAVIRRTGGVFKSAGGDLNELIALFTSVRATTRESAESIATGLRTIFTRIQRPKTIDFLRQYGVELTDLEGKFVGPFEATRRLSKALAGLEQGDLSFIEIAEELGGFRQIGKVIPLIQQFKISQEALNTAIAGSDSLTKDAATAQLALAVRIAKVKEEFIALVRSISESTAFQAFANAALNIASALIKVGEALKPVLPLITAFAAVRFAKGAAGAIGGLTGFARGGVVPGTGNRDSVPAMLTPGEFVIRKSSVAKLGADNLHAMNKYARGGSVKDYPESKAHVLDPKAHVKWNKKAGDDFETSGTNKNVFNPTDEFKYEFDQRDFNLNKYGDSPAKAAYMKEAAAGNASERGRKFEDFLAERGLITKSGGGGKGKGQTRIDAFGPNNELVEIKSYADTGSLEKNINKKVISSAINPVGDADQIIAKHFKDNVGLTKSKNIFSLPAVQLYNDITDGLGKDKKKKAAGGPAIGTDTVPALLTPGEFVVNKKSAQAIGYGNLKNMNRYAKGGVVQHLNTGGKAEGGGLGNIAALAVIPAITSTFSDADSKLNMLVATLSATALQFSILKEGARAVGTEFKKVDTQQVVKGFQKVFKGVTVAGNALTLGIPKAVAGMVAKTNIGRAASQGAQAGMRGTTQAVNLATQGGALTNSQMMNSTPAQRLAAGRMAQQASQGTRATRFAAGAGRAVGGAGRIITKGINKSLTNLQKNFDDISGTALNAAMTFSMVNAVVSSMLTTQEDYAYAVEKGNDALAGELAVRKQAEGDIDAFGGIASGAAAAVATAFLGPQMGQLVGNLTAVGVGLLKLIPGFEMFTGAIRDSLSWFTGGFVQSTEQAKAFGEAASRAAQTSKALAEAQKKASKAQSSFEAGDISATEALNDAFGQAADALTKEREKVMALDTSTTAGKKAVDEFEGRETDLIGQAQPLIQNVAKKIAASGGTFSDVLDQLPAGLRRAIQNQGFGEMEEGFTNMAKELERTQAALDGWNVGLNNISATSTAVSLGLNRLAAESEAGYNALETALPTLKASVTSAAMGISDADMASATGEAVKAMRALGATETQVAQFEENIGAVQQAQKQLPTALAALRSKREEDKEAGRTVDMSDKAIQEDLASMLTEGLVGVDEDVKKRLEAMIATMEIDDVDGLLEGGQAGIAKALEEVGLSLTEGVESATAGYVQYQKQIASLTKESLQLENQYIEAQKKALETQMEVAEILAKHGGAAITMQDRLDNISASGNLDSQSIQGVSNLETGSAAEFAKRAREAQLRSRQVNEQLNAGGPATQGEAGAKLQGEADRLAKFQQQEGARIRDAIKVREGELEIIKSRNAEEKKGLEALLQGDFESFFDSQAATGATAAIATGNQQLMNAFGPAGLAGGFQNLQNMQEAGVQTAFGQQIGGAGGLLERGAQAALSPFGMAGQAETLAGTDPESEAIRAEITELAPVLNTLAETSAMTAESDKQAALDQLEAARMQLEAAKGETGKSMEPLNKATGGLIYASRGMFVPRGSDTVPAMLTPGEFVVRKAAVQRGNNLQLLRAMNSNNKSSSAPAAQALSGGGSVRYLQNGGGVDATGGVGISPETLTSFASALNNFNSELATNIQNLQNTKFQITLNPTNINVNLTGTSFLDNLTSVLKQELFNFVGEEIQQYTVGQNGKLTKDSMGV